MKSESTSTPLLKRLDDLIRRQHIFLSDKDEIYFLGEYTIGAQFSHSNTNKLILNYKKSLDKKELPEWIYKERAINEAAELFRLTVLNTIGLSERINNATLVPIPPSMAKESPGYDDRNFRMLKAFMPKGDIRELILQKETRAPLHSTNSKRSPYDLAKNYYLNEEALFPSPKELWLFDDILTKGTHFRTIHDLLKKELPNIPIVGFFIARSIIREQKIE